MPIMIDDLTARSSTADEVAALRAMAVAAGDQTFLADLLNEGLIEWFSEQMRNDDPTDLHAAYCAANDDVRKYIGERNDGLKTISAQRAMIEALQRDIEFYKRQDEAKDREMMGLNDRIERLEDEQERKLGMIDNLREEVRNLKVKCFDLAAAAGRI